MNGQSKHHQAVKAALVVALSGLATAPAAAQAVTAPVALVLSNSNYSSLPKMASCDLSANLVGSVLSRAGFKVVRQSNLSNARLGTAIASVGEDAAAVPGSRTLIYLCSYAVAYSDRLFVVPAETRLERDSDVLSQGIVARLLMSSVAGPASAAGLVLMDVAPAPKTAPLEFSSMLRASDAAHGGLMVAALPAGDAPGAAPLAAGLSEAIGPGPIEIKSLLATLAAQPALRRSLLTVRPPAEPSWLIQATAPEPPPQVAAPPPPAVALPSPAPAPAVAKASPPVAADTAPAELNPAERRRLQLSLSRLGYYHGRVDGVFASDTAIAIRQFQRDSNAEPTGKLTAKQAEQLLQ